MSVINDAGDALVTYLGTLSGLNIATIARTYVPKYDKTKETALKVFVIPNNMATVKGATRGAIKAEPTLCVALIKKVSLTTTQADVDGLINLVEGVIPKLYKADLGSFAAVTDVNCEALYDPNQLEANSMFMSAITVTVDTYLET